MNILPKGLFSSRPDGQWCLSPLVSWNAVIFVSSGLIGVLIVVLLLRELVFRSFRVAVSSEEWRLITLRWNR